MSKILTLLGVLLVGVLLGRWWVIDEVAAPSPVVGEEVGEVAEGLALDQPLPEDFVSLRPALVEIPARGLSEAEITGILFMREEEKLARDVYLTLYEAWGLPIFSNIAQSEQTHTEAVRQLIEKYQLTDPVTDDALGVFKNPELQTLFNNLTEQGKISLAEALRVGALIEDLDIKDLSDQMALTERPDVTLVYENLQRGSRNHLRSFVAQLNSSGESYEPSFISQSEYEAIIGSSRETNQGAGAQRGWGGR